MESAPRERVPCRAEPTRAKRNRPRSGKRGSLTAFIQLEQVSKAFGTLTVVDRLDLEIDQGRIPEPARSFRLGQDHDPDDAGRLRRRRSNGSIWLDGRRIEHLPPHRRNMGVVFQNYALFPHMTVAENVAFPLEMRGVVQGRRSSSASTPRSTWCSSTHLKDRKPAQLSGGQQQRVALTRALVFEPTRRPHGRAAGRSGQAVARAHAARDSANCTAVSASPSSSSPTTKSEALTMSDRIAVFNAGKIEQLDIRPRRSTTGHGPASSPNSSARPIF